MKEFEIRPAELFNEFLDIAKKDISRFFSKKNQFVDVSCPACGNEKSSYSFEKHGMTYKECDACASLFMSPRPTLEMIDEYYRVSDSSKFWAERFFPETASARQELIFRPRAELLKKITNKYTPITHRVFCDIGAGIGLFLDEVNELKFVNEIIAIEPSQDLAQVCRRKGYSVVEKTLEDASYEGLSVTVASSFEVIEHLFEPVEFLKCAKNIIVPGGLMIFTTLTCSGWDIRNLWYNSKSVSPPHHINLMTTEGLSQMVERAGLDLIELSTPGQLDVDIMRNTIDENTTIKIDRFSSYLLNNRGSDCHSDFQQFLQKHKLSSHALVVARVPE